MGEPMIVAAAAWRLRPIDSDDQFLAHLREFFEQAADAGAHWLVLPELAILELLNLEPKLREDDVVPFLLGFEEHYVRMLSVYARAFGLHVVGGSHFSNPVTPIHVSIILERESRVIQPKNNLTAYERDLWKLSSGKGLAATLDPRVGVLICYDSEFPEAGRQMAEGGVEVLMVPAFTQSRHGFDRVRFSGHARAIENQIFVVQSSLVGTLNREPVPSTYGAAAIIAPSHEPFSENPILAETPHNTEGIAVAHLDFDMLHESRERGDVQNWKDRHAGHWTWVDASGTSTRRSASF